MATSSRPLRCALVVAAVAAPLALGACDPVHPGAAAIVGTKAISIDTLQRLTNQVLAEANDQTRQQMGTDAASLARLQRSVLGRLIDGDLVARAAAQLHVTASEGDVDAEQAQLEQQAGSHDALLQQAALSGIAPAQLRSALRTLVLSDRIGEAVVANEPVTQAQLKAAYQQNIDQFDQVHVAQILVTEKEEADSLLQRVKAHPSSFAALAREFSQDASTRPSGGDLGTVGRSRLDPTFAQAVFAAKVGSFIEARSAVGWHVVHVIAHPRTSLAAAAPQLRATILQSLSQQRENALLEQVSRSLHVHVNPRYGRWTSAGVNPPLDDLSKPPATPPPAAPPQPGTGQPPAGG